MKTLVFAALGVIAQISGLSKTVDPAVRRDAFVARACADWTLTPDDVQFFFAHADAIAGEEWHHAYDVMPCRYEGTIVLDGEERRFEINAGSFAILSGTSPSHDSYYGCKDRCARLFPFHLYGDE
jgi:hypothetical protein